MIIEDQLADLPAGARTTELQREYRVAPATAAPGAHTPAIARHLHVRVDYAQTQKREVFDANRGDILKDEPSLRALNSHSR